MTVNLRKAVRDGVITPEQAAQIERMDSQPVRHARKPAWWQRVIGSLFLATCVAAVVLAPLAFVVWAVRTIFGL